MSEYTPTTKEIRDHWACFYGEFGGDDEPIPAKEAEFDRWKTDNDRQVAAKALRDWADMQERTLEQFAYVADDCDRAETAQWCTAIREYADRIVSEPSTPDLAPNGRAWCHTRHQCHHWFEDECSDACDRGEHDHPNGACTPEQPEGENRG